MWTSFINGPIVRAKCSAVSHSHHLKQRWGKMTLIFSSLVDPICKVIEEVQKNSKAPVGIWNHGCTFFYTHFFFFLKVCKRKIAKSVGARTQNFENSESWIPTLTFSLRGGTQLCLLRYNFLYINWKLIFWLKNSEYKRKWIMSAENPTMPIRPKN